MICINCGKDNKQNNKFCKFCGALISDNANTDSALFKVVRRDNIKLMTAILLGFYLVLAILFAFLTFVTESYTKYFMLAFCFICLIILVVTQIIKYTKLNEIENKPHKNKRQTTKK